MDAKLHVPIVTLFAKNNVNLIKQLNDKFKISVYWNNYQAIPAKAMEKGKNIYEFLEHLFKALKDYLLLLILLLQIMQIMKQV